MLAVTYAFPTSIGPKDANFALERRKPCCGGGRKRPTSNTNNPSGNPLDNSPATPLSPISQQPGRQPGMTTGQPSRLTGAGNTATGSKGRKTTPKERGERRIQALSDKMNEREPSSSTFKDYDSKIGKYSMFPANPPAEIKPGQKIEIFGKPNHDPTNPEINLLPAWSATIDGPNTMTRTSEFRTGGGGLFKAEDHYDGIPIKERVFTSDHIAKTWENYGGQKPMTTNKVSEIANEDLNIKLNEWAGTKGTPTEMAIGPRDPEWPEVMGSSVGSPLAKALTDHPAIFHNHVPTGVEFTRTGNGMWNAAFDLAPRPPPSLASTSGK